VDGEPPRVGKEQAPEARNAGKPSKAIRGRSREDFTWSPSPTPNPGPAPE
jgi:hypothetical protein